MQFNLINFFVFLKPDNSTVTHFLSYITPKSASTSAGYIVGQHVISILTAPNLKIYLVLTLFMLRLSLYKHYAQAYLNLAYDLALSLRRRGTAKITNLKYITTVSSIYQYYGVIATQYVVPVYILMFLALLYKTLGDFSWCIMGANNADIFYCGHVVDSVNNYTSALFKSSSTAYSSPSLTSGMIKRLEEASNVNVTLGHTALNKLFTPLVLRSVVGYFTFWTSTIWFAISCFGLVYYQYIDRNVSTSSE